MLENGWIGHLHAGAPLAAGRSYRHLAPPFAGLRQPGGRADRAGAAGSGRGRLPGARADGGDTPTGRRCWTRGTRGHRIVPGKPALGGGLPATYVEADGEADTLEIDLVDAPSGVDGDAVRHDLRGPAGRRALHADPNGGHRAPSRVRCAMSATLDLPDAAWTMVQLSGTWARERSVVERALVPGRQWHRQPARRLRRRAQPVPGAPPRDHHRGRPARPGARPGLLRQLPGRGGRGLVRDRAPARSASTPKLRLAPGARARPSPRRRPSSPGPTTAWGVSAMPSTACSASASPAARGATRTARSSSTTGRAPTSTSTTTAWSTMARAAKRLGIELFVLDDGWFGARNDDHRGLGDWTVNRAKLPEGLDGLAREVTRPRHAVRPVDRARDGQRRQRPVPGAPGLGDRRPRPQADREPPAAGARPGAAGGGRPPRGRHRRRSWPAPPSTT